MGGDFSVIKVSAEVCNTVFTRHGGGKVAKFTAHLSGGQTGFDAHTGRCNIVIGKTHRPKPSLCCSEVTLCAGATLNKVVEFLGNLADIPSLRTTIC